MLSRAGRRSLLLTMLRASLAGWMALWTLFLIAASWGSGAEGLPFLAAGCLIPGGAAALAWFRPRLGGLGLLVLGVAAWAWLHSRASMLGLVLPAGALGVLAILVGSIEARRARRASAGALGVTRRCSRRRLTRRRGRRADRDPTP